MRSANPSRSPGRSEYGIGASTAPAAQAPKAHIAHSGSFIPRTPTRSPWRMPQEWSVAARARASSTNCGVRTSTTPLGRWNTKEPRPAAAVASSASKMVPAGTACSVTDSGSGWGWDWGSSRILRMNAAGR